MTATPRVPDDVSATLADHRARIHSLEKAQEEDRSEIRSIKSWLMATLAAALISAAGVILSLLRTPVH